MSKKSKTLGYFWGIASESPTKAFKDWWTLESLVKSAKDCEDQFRRRIRDGDVGKTAKLKIYKVEINETT